MSAPPPRIEVVRGAGAKPWHGRIWNNGRLVWSTPQHTRMVGVERAILSACRVYGWRGLKLIWNVPGVEKVFVRFDGTMPIGLSSVHYVDDRRSPPSDLNDATALGQWAADQPEVKNAPSKIHAIKELRALTGAGLVQSKQAVEAIP